MNELFYRNVQIEINTREQEDRPKTFGLSFSSELPVNRFFGIEVLGHKPENVDLEWFNSGTAPLLLDHDTSKQIGVIENARIEKGKAKAKVRFSNSNLAKEVYEDIKSGIRNCVSVGYQYSPEMASLQKQDKEGDVYLIERWKPLEISIVSIPADSSIGIERSMNFKKSINNNMKKIGNVNSVNSSGNCENKIIYEDASDILILSEKHNKKNLGVKAVKDGMNLEQFRKLLLEDIASKPVVEKRMDNMLGVSKKEAKEFSIMRAINASITGSWENAGFEREISREVAKKLGRQPSGFFMPIDVLGSDISKRELQKQNQESAGFLVPNNYLEGSFIEMLRSRMIVSALGAKILSGLEGDITIPKQIGGATAFWVAESQAPDESAQKFSHVNMTPKTLAAYTDFSRKLILQASPDIENLVRSDLATTLALEIDRAALCGSGQDPEPKGIINHDITRIDANQDDNLWATIIELETALSAANADIGSLAYICNAGVRGMLKTREKSLSTAQFLWQDTGYGQGSLNGMRAFATNQMPVGQLLFGNFSDLIIGHWGALDVLVDPYSLGRSGGVRIRLMQDIDIAIRHSESFAVANIASDVSNDDE